MLSCHDIADFFLSQVDPEAGELMSNLKLQKLVYYAQGLHLAITGIPLFNEPIEAWAHGPVVPELYRRFKSYGAGAITESPEVDLEKFSDQTIELLLEVYQVYGQFSAFKLRNMTHEEPPWLNTPSGEVIAQAAMAEFFKTRIA
ncbi:Panacea domain-containing protein [Paludibaculum fermentans]|uniref:Panacea domain-containing protein n=1 Tax=Paludibaculum fermentans TaxID=1473598 RepID=UPI003EBED876